MKTSVKSKKQIALLSAGALLSLGIAATAGGLTASAATTELQSGAQSSGQVTLTREVEEAWKVSFEDSVTLAEGKGELTITVADGDDLKIAPGASLKVTVNSNNNWQLQNGTDNVAYTAKTDFTGLDGNNLDNDTNNTVMQGITSESSDKNAKLTFTYSEEDLKHAGSYQDTLTFNVTVS